MSEEIYSDEEFELDSNSSISNSSSKENATGLHVHQNLDSTQKTLKEKDIFNEIVRLHAFHNESAVKTKEESIEVDYAVEKTLKRLRDYRKKELLEIKKKRNEKDMKERLKIEEKKKYWQLVHSMNQTTFMTSSQRIQQYLRKQRKEKELSSSTSDLGNRWYNKPRNSRRSTDSTVLRSYSILPSRRSSEIVSNKEIDDKIRKNTKKLLMKSKKIINRISGEYERGSYILRKLEKEPVRKIDQRSAWKPGPYNNRIECMENKNHARRVFGLI